MEMRAILNVFEDVSNRRVIAFHGTGRSFKAFRIEKSDAHPSKIGAWFASTPEAAEHIATKLNVGDSPRVITAELTLGNVKVYPDYAAFLADWRNYGDSKKMRRALMRDGFNSLAITDSTTDGAGLRTDYAVFESWQIRITGSRDVLHEAADGGSIPPELRALANEIRGKSWQAAKRTIVSKTGSIRPRERFDDDLADAIFLRIQARAQAGLYNTEAIVNGLGRNARRLEGPGKIKLYRAAPKGGGIRPGDFAAATPGEARNYAHGKNIVQSAVVPRVDVFAVDGSTGGDQEYIYLPRGHEPVEPVEHFDSFRSFYDAANGDVLAEDASSDIAQHQRALRMISQLCRFFSEDHADDHWGAQVLHQHGQDHFVFQGHDIGWDGEAANTYLILSPSDGENHGNRGVMPGSDHPFIQIFGIPDTGAVAEAVGAFVDSEQMRDTLLHELIHQDDAARNPAMDKQTRRERGAYYNSPHEFNAFYHQLSAPMMHFLDAASKSTNPEAIARLADRLHLHREFMPTIRDLIQSTGGNASVQEFLDHVDDIRMKKLLKRLYALHKEVVAYL
jgi:hypothetical protein